MNLHSTIPHNSRTYQLIANFQQTYQKCSHKIGQPHQNATKWKHHIPLQHGCSWVNTYISLTLCALITQSTALSFTSFSLPQINKALNLIQSCCNGGVVNSLKREDSCYFPNAKHMHPNLIMSFNSRITSALDSLSQLKTHNSSLLVGNMSHLCLAYAAILLNNNILINALLLHLLSMS
mgnify:CR=1 FL=1